jgi:putative MATE family efflux protein
VSESDADDARVDMTTGAIAPKLLALSWPLVAGNLLQTAYNVADLFWVGRVGPDAVAAVSLMFPTTWMFVSTAIGVSAATVALVSQNIGAGNERQAERAVAQSVLLAIALGVILVAVGYTVRAPLVSLIGAEGAVYDAALAYLEIILLSIPLTFLFFAFRAALRAAGDTRTAMWLVAISAGINIVIDPIFILGFDPLGIPAMGVRGAAWATLLSRGIATATGVYILVDGGWGIRMRIADLRPDPPLLRELIDVGYPASLDGLTRSFAAVALAGIVARFGTVPTAAYGVVLRVMSVTWTVSGAVGQAAATGVGQNLGAGTPDRARSVTWIGTAGTMAVLGGFAAVVFAFPATTMRVFGVEGAVVAEGVRTFRVIAPFWAFFGGLMVVQGGFRGAGQTRVAFLLSLLSRWVFRLPVALVLAFPLAYGAIGVWWGMAFASVVTFVVGVLWFRRGGWEEGLVEEDDEDAGSEAVADAPGDEPEAELTDD